MHAGTAQRRGTGKPAFHSRFARRMPALRWKSPRDTCLHRISSVQHSLHPSLPTHGPEYDPVGLSLSQPELSADWFEPDSELPPSMGTLMVEAQWWQTFRDQSSKGTNRRPVWTAWLVTGAALLFLGLAGLARWLLQS